jgi:hypothetical protein
MKVVFDLRTKEVTGLNRPAQPFEFEADFKGVPQATKTVQVPGGIGHKTNEDGELLYLDTDGTEVTYAVKHIEARIDSFEKLEDLDGDGEDERVVIDEVEVPAQTIELQPVMETKAVDVEITFEERPLSFTYDEIVNAPVKLTPEEALRKENLELKLALALQYEDSANFKLETQLALAELYEMTLV